MAKVSLKKVIIPDILEATKACIEFLSETDPNTGKHSGRTDDDRFRTWRQAANLTPGFLADDFMACYEKSGKNKSRLSNHMVRGCITFWLRVMRYEYGPHPCLVDGELLSLLRRWIELNDPEAQECSSKHPSQTGG